MSVDTTTPDEGLLQAYLDDELAGEDRRLVESHLAADPGWAQALDELSEAAALLKRGLIAQDTSVPSDGPPPWIGVLNRGAQSAPRRFPLGRAASLAALLAGAVATGLPGSPVRAWFADQFSPTLAVSHPAPDLVSEPPVGDNDPAEVGVRVGTPAGALRVVMPALPPGTELWVGLDSDAEAGVFGPAGTRFRTRDGRVDVLNPTGVIRVQLPATLGAATILVDDAVYLRKDGEVLEVTGPVSARSETEIRFGPGSGGP